MDVKAFEFVFLDHRDKYILKDLLNRLYINSVLGFLPVLSMGGSIYFRIGALSTDDLLSRIQKADAILDTTNSYATKDGFYALKDKTKIIYFDINGIWSAEDRFERSTSNAANPKAQRSLLTLPDLALEKINRYLNHAPLIKHYALEYKIIDWIIDLVSVSRTIRFKINDASSEMNISISSTGDFHLISITENTYRVVRNMILDNKPLSYKKTIIAFIISFYSRIAPRFYAIEYDIEYQNDIGAYSYITQHRKGSFILCENYDIRDVAPTDYYECETLVYQDAKILFLKQDQSIVGLIDMAKKNGCELAWVDKNTAAGYDMVALYPSTELTIETTKITLPDAVKANILGDARSISGIYPSRGGSAERIKLSMRARPLKVYVDAVGEKYVRIERIKTYLRDIRGKYRYLR